MTRTAVAGDEEGPRPFGNTFTGNTTGGGPPPYVTVNGTTYRVESVSYRSDGQTDYRVRREPPPGRSVHYHADDDANARRWPPRRPVPVPEPLPEVLRWACVRLDRPPEAAR